MPRERRIANLFKAGLTRSLTRICRISQNEFIGWHDGQRAEKKQSVVSMGENHLVACRVVRRRSTLARQVVRSDDPWRTKPAFVPLPRDFGAAVFVLRQRCERRLAGAAGLEPVTSAVTGQRSNQLSYAPAMGVVKLKEASGSVKRL